MLGNTVLVSSEGVVIRTCKVYHIIGGVRIYGAELIVKVFLFLGKLIRSAFQGIIIIKCGGKRVSACKGSLILCLKLGKLLFGFLYLQIIGLILGAVGLGKNCLFVIKLLVLQILLSLSKLVGIRVLQLKQGIACIYCLTCLYGNALDSSCLVEFYLVALGSLNSSAASYLLGDSTLTDINGRYLRQSVIHKSI